MKLINVRIQNFRNILDTETEIEPDVTCLVGKNESGKTAFLHALDRLNPERTGARFDVHTNYPAWIERKHRRQRQNLEEFIPASAIFDLEDTDKKAISDRFGPNALNSKSITVHRNYKNELIIDFDSNEKAAVKSVMHKTSLPTELQSVKSFVTFVDVSKSLGEWLEKEENDDDDIEKVTAVQKHLSSILDGGEFDDEIWKMLHGQLPGFLYFDNYSTLPYTTDIKRILNESADLKPNEITARSLLRLGGADKDYLLNPNYERRKRELQNVANGLGQDVLDYWTTNKDLRVDPDITLTTEQLANGQTAVTDELKLMIFDSRHSLSLPFDEHSSGFQWFFSFLAAFSEYEFIDRPLIILLDEPALGLHARAQKDFLRFINERLATDNRQVIFSTHSPFMVEPGNLHRVRVVEDKGVDEGAKVSSDILTTDADTLFPLQGALGYDLAQHLFVAEHNLVVEGTSDFTYLSVISDYLSQTDREGHDKKWSIIPVGGADLIPTFVALLGHHLNITVLVDAKRGGNQRLNKMAKNGYLSSKRIITIGQIIGKANADIEDLFTVNDYLMLYNTAFSASIKVSDLKGTDTLVRKIARHIGEDDFDHGRPADVFLRNRDEYLPKLSAKTLGNFEKLFKTVNKTL